MGSLVSRRKRTVKVEARSISVQATECGIRESQTTGMEASLEKQKNAIVELRIGDGLNPSPENTGRQITKEESCAANESRRKIGLPSKAKIRPRFGKKNQSQESKDFSTQYDFFSVDAQNQATKKTNPDTENCRSLKTDTCGVKGEEVVASIKDENIRQQNPAKTSRNTTDEAVQSPSDGFTDKAAASGHREGQGVTSEVEKLVSPRLRQTNDAVGQTQAIHRMQEAGQNPNSPNKPDTETNEFIGDNGKPAVADPRAKPLIPDPRSGLKSESLKHAFNETIPRFVEVLEAGEPHDTLSEPSGNQAHWHHQQTDKTNREAERKDGGQSKSATILSSQLEGSHASYVNGSKDETNRKENDSRPQEEALDDKTVDAADGCQDEDIDEDTLDWNVDDRVRSPSDPEKEEDTYSCSWQEVIAASGTTDREECQEDVMVTGYCGDDGAGGREEEDDMVEDVLDINVDDRVHSPADPRSDAQLSSDEDDDTIDLLMNCSMVPDATLPGQRQNSLTTLKDGDSAGGSIYSPPQKSPLHRAKNLTEAEKTSFSKAGVEQIHRHKKEQFVTEQTSQLLKESAADIENQSRTGHVCNASVSTAENELKERSMPSEMSGSENRSSQIDNQVSILPGDNNGSYPNPAVGLVAQEQAQIRAENTEDLPTLKSHDSTQSQANRDKKPLRKMTNASDSSESVGKSQKYDTKADKLVMNVGDKPLSFGANDKSKSILQMQEKRAMTLLLLRGTLPCESNEDVKRGAGDSRTVDVTEADLTDDNCDANERAGIAAMLNDRSKSSCQLEQLQSEHSQMDNGHDDNQDADERAGIGVTLEDRFKSSSQLEQFQAEDSQMDNPHNIEPYNTPPLQNSQQRENDSNAACAPARDSPQANRHMTADVSQECNLSSVCGNDTHDHLVHGAAAASFMEERMEESLLPPRRPASPGAAASSGDWEIIMPRHQEPTQTNVGGLAACASSTRSRVRTNCTHETATYIHNTVTGREVESNRSIIEVQAAEITGTMAQSLPDESPAQQDLTVQAPNTLSQGENEQNHLIPRQAEILSTHDVGKHDECSEEKEPNVKETNDGKGDGTF